jgi:diguanylate cyclase (GGDEF)-like protein
MRLLVVCAVLACSVPSMRALDPEKRISQYVHDVWDTNDGLPQDSVNAMAQTPDGYLWVATQEGLARFDGLSFTTFDAHTTRGVLQNFVYALFTDRRGTLWAGASGGLLRYEGNGRFSRTETEGEWPGPSAKQISEDSRGTLWVGMGSDGTSGAKGLVEYRGGVRAVFKTKDGLSSDVVSYTAFDRNGNHWLATSNGIDVMAKGRVVRSYTTAHGLGSNVVRVVLIDRAGTVWAGTDTGLSFLENGRISTYTTHDGLTDDKILHLLEDRDGVLWIATSRGLNRIVGGKIEAASLTGIADRQINSLFEDREGSLWIGTRASGLHRLRSASFTTIGPNEGLAGEIVNGIFEDRAGRIWMGISPGGVNIFEGGRLRTLPGALPNGARAFREDADGTMWLGSRDGLHVLGQGRLETFPQAEGGVHATFRDRRGVVWIGTGNGLLRFENGTFVKVPTPRGFPGGLRLIFEDRRGRLWFAGGEGLAFHDGNAFHVDPRFAKANLMSVSEDADGTLWFGTWSQGLHRLRDGHLARYTTASGLYDDVAWSVLDDGRGYLWMGSNRGIYRVAKKDLDDYAARRIATIACKVYGTADGMRRRETNWGSPAAIRARDGRLWFGTTGGVVIVDPAAVGVNRNPPPVVLERFVADDAEVSMEKRPALAPGTRNLEIHYAGLSLVAPDKIRYRYRLDGYDERWIDAGSRRTAFYTNVAPGTYRFRVIAANEDGVWNETGASLQFRLQPYFRQTGWFYALVVAALILFGVALNAFRERQRRIRHQAFHDPLTGLPNRMHLDQRAALALGAAQKQRRSMAILFLDLDGFKSVNDTLGHASGDRLLQLVAARFRGCLRDGDTLARIGGDEFAVLVEALESRSAAAEIARRVIDAVREPFVVDGHPAAIGVSIGIAVHPGDGDDVRTILLAADRAMYRAKTAGNAFEFHSE